MNHYQQMKDRQQAEFNTFPMKFAFSDAQFAEGMRELGLTAADTDKVYGFCGTGGFYRREDAPRLHEMLRRHHEEMQQAIAADSDGTGFIFDMFSYELSNHEYCITLDVTDALQVLGLTAEQVNADDRLLYGLKLACKAQMEWYKKFG